MRLYLIRHAESEANTQLHLVGGQVNEVPLTSKGRSQAEALGKRLQRQQIRFAEVHSSTAVRASHTAQIACGILAYDTANIQYTDRLVEISQGEWTGKLRAEVYTPEMSAIIRQNPWEFKPPQGESQRDVEERAWQYLEQHIFSKTWAQDDIIAVFAHGIVIKCIIKHFLDSNPLMTWKINLENTSITAFQYKEPHGWYMEWVNDASHLL
ncbi:MAG: histidine phosphatase family protein [Bacteroidetes bacterium]|nr:MAG: histidine phosphatase family protein [Bacteroidota bacterium]